MNQKEKFALFLLRFGLGTFLLLWSIDKLVAPESTVKIFQVFYTLEITTPTATFIGFVEVLLSLAIITGWKKQYSYAIGCIIHAISTFSTWPQLLDPFGKNHLFIAGLPILFAFIALYLLRKKDTLWSLDT